MTSDERDASPPDDLQLLQAFVNTNDLEGGRDDLGTPAQLRDWLVANGLVAPGAGSDEAAHRRALAVREGIRALGRANNGEPLARELVAAMNAAAANIPVTLAIKADVGDGGWRVVPAADGTDAFLGRLLGTVAKSIADGTWSRVKACRNDSCRWLFYDRSRNRSGTWCTMAICGSRLKARAYRARQRAAAGG